MLVAMYQSMLVVSVSSLLTPLIVLLLKPFIKDVISVCRKIRHVLHTIIKRLAHDDSIVDSVIANENDHGGAPRPLKRCERCARRGTLTYGDVEVVMASLGLVGWKGGADDTAGKYCKECDTMEVVYALMENKKANEAELEEAFYVFDRNEDGFICAAELWNVMRRLGLEEGVKYEDCKRMIDAFDEDGDGRISFREFKRMMENAV